MNRRLTKAILRSSNNANNHSNILKFNCMKKLITFAVLLLTLSIGAHATAYIYGSLGICVGGTTTLYSDTTTFTGTWSSSTTSVATVGSSTGVVNGVAPGTSTITYVGSSGTATAVVTVWAAPSPITGGTSPICVGSTTALSVSPAGGSWSSYSSYIATVGASTGVVTGVHGGTTTIQYTLGSSCYVTKVVTVNSTTDSLWGPSTVCLGSTATMSTTAGSGTWSSSNPAVATVSGGVVTGVSVGSATISLAVTGSCGTVTLTKVISVISTVSAGTLSGTSTITAGSSVMVYATVSGGAWSSSTTSVATVSSASSSSGTITGVAAGTSTISYTVSGCGGSATATKVVTVTPFDGISGHVLFGSGSFYGPVKVWLVRYNPSTLMLYAADSTTVYSSGTSAFYQFTGAVTDSYRVKADALDSMFTTTGYIPTYHTSSSYWNSATVFHHTAGTSDINKDINMGYGTVTSGPGFIAGNVTMGANKGTAGSVPAVGMLMYVINQSTGAIMQKTLTDASGNYSFSNLPVGQTYKIYPELMNYVTTPYTSITLTSSGTSMSIANFEQHTLSHTITPIITTSVAGINATAMSLFPNPAGKTITLSANMNKAEEGTLVITDITGREMYRTSIEMTTGANNKTVDVTGFAAGMYLVSYNSASAHYVNTISVQH